MHFSDRDIRPNVPLPHPGSMVAPGADARWRDAPEPHIFIDGMPVQLADSTAMRDRQIALRNRRQYR